MYLEEELEISNFKTILKEAASEKEHFRGEMLAKIEFCKE